MKKGFTVIEALVVGAIILILGLMIATKVHACGSGWFETPCGSATSLQEQEQVTVSENQNRMEKAAPLPILKDSLERINIKKRLETWTDPNKVSYIYLTSYGRVMAFYTVKGKVTSGGKRMTSTERLIGCDGGEYNADCIMESPELDGTYGTSGQYIFFWTTDGTYVQWNGEYMLADQPLKLTTQPELVREIK